MSKMLSSWKEIAHFFGKGVRTVQRWEKTLDLPIHRPPGAPSNVVLARTSDLEEWMHRGPAARALAEPSEAVDISSGLGKKLSKLETEVGAMAEMVGLQNSSSDLEGRSPEERVAALIDHVIEVNARMISGRTAKAA